MNQGQGGCEDNEGEHIACLLNEDINEKRPGGGLMSIYVSNAYRLNVSVFESTNRTLMFLLVLCSWALDPQAKFLKSARPFP